MLNGDISNRVEPRLLVVFEGLIALPPERQMLTHFGRRAGKIRKQVQQLRSNEKAARVINDTVWRHRYAVDVVTFMGEEYIEPVTDWLDEHGIPASNVIASERPLLARELVYRLDVVGVFSPDPNDALVFGSKGYIVNPDAPRLVGGYSW